MPFFLMPISRHFSPPHVLLRGLRACELIAHLWKKLAYNMAMDRYESLIRESSCKRLHFHMRMNKRMTKSADPSGTNLYDMRT